MCLTRFLLTYFRVAVLARNQLNYTYDANKITWNSYFCKVFATTVTPYAYIANKNIDMSLFDMKSIYKVLVVWYLEF